MSSAKIRRIEDELLMRRGNFQLALKPANGQAGLHQRCTFTREMAAVCTSAASEELKTAQMSVGARRKNFFMRRKEASVDSQKDRVAVDASVIHAVITDYSLL
ncbi:hypothetical protein J6590_092864 [Homalodisca vitripennis]|nr:hypothetical protein J6590_092864 [Homalodisca vitripennis]